MVNATLNKQRQYMGVLLVLAVFAPMLSGCAHKSEPLAIDSLSQPRMPPVPVLGSIYSAGTEMTLFEDIKARRVGDILTVMLVEQNSGTKSTDNKISQNTAMSLDPPLLGGVTRPGMGVNVGTKSAFSGDSGSSQSNSLSGSVTVTVTAILPGGNLRVQGEKWMEINQGKEYIRLDGIVRPNDVRTNNTVLSTQVADAHISYSGTGTNGNAGVVGWIGKLLFSPFRPF